MSALALTVIHGSQCRDMFSVKLPITILQRGTESEEVLQVSPDTQMDPTNLQYFIFLSRFLLVLFVWRFSPLFSWHYQYSQRGQEVRDALMTLNVWRYVHLLYEYSKQFHTAVSLNFSHFSQVFLSLSQTKPMYQSWSTVSSG